MSGVPSDNEILSSPIPIRDDGETLLISTKPIKKQKRSARGDDENDDISLWSEAKKQSWAAIDTNPNAFFYRHCAPGEKKRNGAWDAHEKKLFIETMKVHPPSQGKWGLFAQHIPGRVGYQCRNYYHRLLESGEVKALPEELEKMQRPRKKKSSSKESSPKVNQTIKIIEEIEPEFTFQPDEKDSSTQSEDEEPTINQVVKIRFVSQKLKDFEASGKDLKSIPFFDVKQEEESSDVEFEIITYLDNDLALKPTQQSLESHQQTTEKVQPIVDVVNQTQKPNEVLNQDEASFEDLPMPIEDQQPVLDNQKLIQIKQTHKVEENHKAEENKIVKNEIPENSIIPANTLQTIEEKHEESTTLKWSPRMKEPWKTLKPHQIERLKNKAKERSFQYESSKILNSNIDHPLNLILFSVPTDSNKTALYINSVRDHLVRSDQVQKDNLLKEYFRASSESDGYRKFVDYVIQTTPK